jgi:hypothetical protein
LDRLKICELRAEIEEIWGGTFQDMLLIVIMMLELKESKRYYLNRFNPLTEFFPEKIDASEHRS